MRKYSVLNPARLVKCFSQIDRLNFLQRRLIASRLAEPVVGLLQDIDGELVSPGRNRRKLIGGSGKDGCR